MINYDVLLDFAKKTFPELNDMIIILKDGERFSCIPINDNYFIITYTTLKEDYFKKNICSYLQDKFDFKDSLKMLYNWEEIFSFFHEIGHIVNYNKIYNEDRYYNNYKNKTYTGYQQAFRGYRSIPTEELSDMTALEIIESNLVSLYMLCNNQTKEEAIYEISFWNEVC